MVLHILAGFDRQNCANPCLCMIMPYHCDIFQFLPSNPLFISHSSNPKPHWSITPNVFLHHKSLMYVPNSSDFHLHILWYRHDHILFRHPGQNKTVSLILQDYTWPGLCDTVKKYCKSCTTCMHAKPQHHKLYGLLKQLPVPIHLWNSISMDFIETLPTSLS